MITQDAKQGRLEGAAGEDGLLTGLKNADAGAYNFQVTVNGRTSDPIEVSVGTYDSQAELAEHLQTQINNDAKLKEGGNYVDVVWSEADGRFEITSRNFGRSSTVSVTALGENAAQLGLDTGASTAGQDVAGTFNGEAGFGSGKVLLPALGSDAYGISLIVQPGVTETTLTFSRGFGAELSKTIDTYLARNGVLDKSRETLKGKVKGLEEEQTKLDTRMEAYYERLLAQFMAMENIINSLNSSGSALDNIGDYLPFTARRN